MEILQPFVQAQIFEPVDTDLQTEEGGELFIHPSGQALAVHAQHMMTVVELFQHAVQLAAYPLMLAHPKDLDDLIRREAE